LISDSVPAQTPPLEPVGGEAGTTPAPRPRWVVPVVAAVVVLAAAIGVIAGLTLNGTRSSGSGAAASYVPADATVYYELRLDLPGDQRANLRTFLGHFPGVDADKYLTDEVDKQLDSWASQIPGSFSYSADVKPWFNGSLAFATIGVPSVMGVGTAGASSLPKTLVFAGVRDAAGATAFSDRLRAEIAKAGGTVTSSTHGSATIWSATGIPGTSVGGSKAPQTFAWTITADEVVGGTSTDLVGSALDVHAGTNPSLADRQEFRDGLSRLPADRVLVAAVDVAQMMNGFKQELSTLQPGAGDALNEILAQIPTFVVTSSTLLADRISLDSNALMPSGSALPANRDRGLAALAPDDAIFFTDGADVGRGLTAYVNAIKKAVATSPAAAAQLQQAEAVLGGDLASLVSWIGDAALVAGETNRQPYVGLIITPTNAADARVKLSQLRGLLQLAAGAGGQVSVTDADHGGTTITTIKVAAGAGTPAWATTYQYAVTDSHVIIGNGEVFVARVLDTDSAHSLAGQARFSAGLAGQGGASNIGTIWLDLAGLRAAIEPLIPTEMQTEYRSKVQPWLAPLDYVIGTNTADGQRLASRMAIVVK
jgi:hypothetical protein